MNKIISVLVILILSACGQLPKVKPTDSELASANYGIPPNKSEFSELLRKYLKKSGYKDPNSAQVEDCSDPQKKWQHVEDEYTPKYFYGWQFECDLNAKNSMGGYVGFSRETFLFKDGEVRTGRIPQYDAQQPVQGLPLFTPPNGQPAVIWK